MISGFSPAKLNLFLYVTGQRPDGYHNIQTVFQLIDYGDTLFFRVRNDNKLNLITPLTSIPNETNLITIAARRLKCYAAEHQLAKNKVLGADIRINKILQIGAGLGGGSSNAATTLIMLNHLWQLNLSCKDLMGVGRQIGADVPIFIAGHSAFAEGIGDKLTPVILDESWFLVIKPTDSVSTVTIFSHPQLPRTTAKRSLSDCFSSPFYNDCEKLVRQLYPHIDDMMNEIAQLMPVRLTGTGSCFFATFPSEHQAQIMQKRLPAQMHSFIAKGINRSPIRGFTN